MNPASAAAPGVHYCNWCGSPGDPNGTNCPRCGAAIDVRTVVAASGWAELPPIQDMARLQFGQSYCQIEGNYVPVADMNLSGQDSVYFTHHVLLWKDPAVQIDLMPLQGAWKRLFSGMPLVMTQAHGPGHIAFSRDEPGEMIALPLQPGQPVDVREGVFMVATGQVSYDFFNTNIYFVTGSGDDKETHYPVGYMMDRFSSGSDPGLLLLHGAGNVFVRRLEPGETILVKPTALLFKDSTVRMHLHIEHPGRVWRSWRTWGERYLWLRLYGPGRVAVQSAFTHMEENGNTLSSVSMGTTRHQW